MHAAPGTIVVGVDGSAPSFNALRWATHLAKRRSMPIKAIATYSFPVFGVPGSAAFPNAIDTSLYEEGARGVVGRALAIVEEIDPSVVVDGAVEVAHAAEAIANEAADGDLIVLGSSGYSRALVGLIGSTATGVVHRSKVPVVVVPAGSDPETRHGKVVVGVDNSSGSEKALHWAYAEAEAIGARLVVLHAWTYPYGATMMGMPPPHPQMKRDAEEALSASLEALGDEYMTGAVPIEPKLVEEATATALLAEAVDADLLVLGSHGRGAIRSALLGSVSRSVLHHLVCPTAVIHIDREPKHD